MKKMFVLLVASCLGFAPVHGQEQDYVDLDKITQISPDNQKKVTAALAAADAVKKAGAYIESLSDLLQDGTLSFPVGVKKGDYELIVHHIEYDSETHNPKIYATCAFKFKDSGEKVAFAGEAVFTGHSGVEMNGSLALIAPVRQNLGKGAAIIIKEGTKVNFDCDGVNNFDAKLTWMVTSGKIKPVNSQGEPTGKPLAVNFDAKFAGFDNYAVSLNINQSFTFQGLDDVIFTLKGAILDQSDTETSPMTRFPENYFTPVSEDVRQLWKGVAVTEASVSLPGVFKKPETNDERIILAMQDVLFDENGFSGYVSGKDVIPSENINRERWDISLSDLSIGFLKENLVSFGFGGHVNIPPLGKNALIPYRASFNPQLERYEIKAGIAGIYEFPVFKSTLALKDISTIEIAFKNGGVYPAIDASGKLSIDAPLGNDSVKTFSVPDIEFEHLIISRESPYVQIGNISVTGDFRSPKLGGFELSITDIQSFKNEKGSGLTFKTGVSLGDMFDGITSIQLLGDYEHWKFKEVFVDRVKVDYKSKAFSIAGDVWFKNSDPVYGNGFRGSVKLSVLEKFDFDAIGVFGEKDNYKYFLADVFYETAPTTGIFVPPVLSFYGFGGGLYRRMQQASKMPATSTANADNDFGKSLSGISYLPDSKIGLGFMATTKFSMQSSSSLFNAKVGLEMQFNNYGGLNFVQFRGDAGFMDNANKWGKLSDNITKKLNDLEAKEGVGNFQKADKKALMNQAPENLNSGLLTASLNIEYDLMNQVFSADLNTYLNAGLMKGIGQNNRLGGASAYFSPNKWYAYLGTPSDRLGIDILNLAKANAYFMLGDDMPALPPPPQKVLKNLSADKQAKLARTNTAKLNMGAGLAFGTGLEVNFDANLTPFYAHIGAGIGAEFLLSDLNGRTCVGFSGTPGFNGWFAQTQAWAYAEADIGIRVKIFGNRRSFSILDISASTLLEGSGPNPMYFAGAVGGRFSVLGGLVRGHCTFDFEIGEKCIIEKDSPFDEEVIAQLTPAEGAKDVNVFAAPQVLFNIPVDVRMTIDEENGTKGAYMVTLEECTAKYKDAGKIIAGQNKFSSDGLVYMLTPDEPFESQKEVEMIAKVSFKKLVNNKWEYVKGDDGKPVFESKTTAFHTGDRPKEILPEHVAYSYPINRQYNFYPKETNQGYLLLMQNYSYLFTTDKPAGFDQKLRIGTADGQKTEKSFSYTTHSSISGVKMEIGFPLEHSNFENNKIYKLSIVNIPQKENAGITSNITETTTQMDGIKAGIVEITRREATSTIVNLAEKEIYSLTFKTSQHDTFEEKIRSFEQQANGWRDPIYPYIHNINTDLREPELFDAYEIGSANVNAKIVDFTAQTGQTPWFTQTLYNGMYTSQAYLTVPNNKISILQMQAPDKLLSDDEIMINIPSGYGISGVMRYELAYQCALDMTEAKNKIGEKFLHKQTLTAAEIAILNQNFPPVVFQGNYPVTANYTLPGRNTITSTVNFYIYNPINQ